MKLIRHLRLTQTEFANRIGKSHTAVNRVIKGNIKFPAEWKNLIWDTFQVNIDDFQSTDVENQHASNRPNVVNKKTHVIPFYDIAATGSTKDTSVMDSGRAPVFIDVGDLLPKAECVIRVAGNSMTPNYPSGSLIGLRRIMDGLFDYGSVYVIETADNRFVKRVFKGKTEDCILLYSDNIQTFDSGPRQGQPMYEPFNLPLEKVKRVFKVVGCARLNDHSHIPDF